MGIHQKLFSVMCDTEGLEKDLTVGSGSNSYRAIGEKAVLNMLKPLFKKYKLICIPKDGEITENNSTWNETYNSTVSTKKRNVTQLKVFFDIIDIETGERETIVGFGNGADSQDKGSGKAFTYAFKTALNKTFMMFSGEDADNTHSDDINTSVKVKVTTADMDKLVKIAEKKGIDYSKLSDYAKKKYTAVMTKLTAEQYVEMLKYVSSLVDSAKKVE